MDEKKQIEELCKDVESIHRAFLEDDDYDYLDEYISVKLHGKGYRKQNEVIDEFADKLKDYPIEVRLPLLGLETKEEIEMYVNNLFDQIEEIIDKIAKEMKGE